MQNMNIWRISFQNNKDINKELLVQWQLGYMAEYKLPKDRMK